jgi:hypothetical protein
MGSVLWIMGSYVDLKKSILRTFRSIAEKPESPCTEYTFPLLLGAERKNPLFSTQRISTHRIGVKRVSPRSTMARGRSNGVTALESSSLYRQPQW